MKGATDERSYSSENSSRKRPTGSPRLALGVDLDQRADGLLAHLRARRRRSEVTSAGTADRSRSSRSALHAPPAAPSARDRGRAAASGVTASRRRLLPSAAAASCRVLRVGALQVRDQVVEATGVGAAAAATSRGRRRTRAPRTGSDHPVIRSYRQRGPPRSARDDSRAQRRAQAVRGAPGARALSRQIACRCTPTPLRGQRLRRALEHEPAALRRRPPGPRSMTQSACFTTSMLCSITTSGGPGLEQPLEAGRAARRCRRCAGRWSARRGRRARAGRACARRCAASLMRCASPPESVVAGWPEAQVAEADLLEHLQPAHDRAAGRRRSAAPRARSGRAPGRSTGPC